MPTGKDAQLEAMPPFGPGLRLFGVLALEALPASVLEALVAAGADPSLHRQLLVIGHVGKELFDALPPRAMLGDDPIDDYAADTVRAHFAERFPGRSHRLLFPHGETVLPLQSIGALLGLHHASPFMVGIDARFGSWFAYRALLVADTDLPVTQPSTAPSPCDGCASRVCVTACPPRALTPQGFDLDACIAHRLLPGSPCAETCLARIACPVGEEHRYGEAQLRYHYGRSLRTLQTMVRRPREG